jgi:hypothetical protein
VLVLWAIAAAMVIDIHLMLCASLPAIFIAAALAAPLLTYAMCLAGAAHEQEQRHRSQCAHRRQRGQHRPVPLAGEMLPPLNLLPMCRTISVISFIHFGSAVPEFILLAVLQVPTGIEIVLKVFANVSWP